MPISFRNDPATSQAGFTLVELMVVLFLIGLAATAVVLTIGSTARGAGSQAEQFAARIAALRDRSVIESRPFAFWVRPSGYGFETRKDRQWLALDKKPFATTNWRAPFTAEIPGQRVLRIAFDANGLPSAPLEVVLSGGAVSLRVTMDATGKVNVAR